MPADLESVMGDTNVAIGFRICCYLDLKAICECIPLHPERKWFLTLVHRIHNIDSSKLVLYNTSLFLMMRLS